MTASAVSNVCKAGEGHLVIHPDGQTEFVAQVELGVEGRQAIIGGRFDCVYLQPGLDMWIHDEGKFVCDLNPVASTLFQLLTRRTDDAIWGTVILSAVDDEGVSLPLGAGTAHTLRELIGHLRELVEQLARQHVLTQGTHLVTSPSASEDRR